jgi:hypothetical protein
VTRVILAHLAVLVLSGQKDPRVILVHRETRVRSVLLALLVSVG